MTPPEPQATSKIITCSQIWSLWWGLHRNRAFLQALTSLDLHGNNDVGKKGTNAITRLAGALQRAQQLTLDIRGFGLKAAGIQVLP